MAATATATATMTMAVVSRAVDLKAGNKLCVSGVSPSSSISLLIPKNLFTTTTLSTRPSLSRRPVAARGYNDAKKGGNQSAKGSKEKEQVQVTEEEVEEDLPWIQEKALDLVEFTGSVTQTIPGPRVGHSSLPWILAVPLAYIGVSFVIAFVKTVRKLGSPKAKRRKLVQKNATLLNSIDELLQKGRDELLQIRRDELDHAALMDVLRQKGRDELDQAALTLIGLMQKTGFDMVEILRKYIRYALNEKPFNLDLIVDLLQLRKASGLDDSVVGGVLNDISRRIVRDKGPVVMDMSGYSEKGLRRKVTVQLLFAKLFYLSELPEFCSRDTSLTVKEIFGVTDDDAEKLRLQLISEAEVIDSLEKLVDDESDSEKSDSEDP